MKSKMERVGFGNWKVLSAGGAYGEGYEREIRYIWLGLGLGLWLCLGFMDAMWLFSAYSSV
jgi:hypothetical protein